MTLYGWHYFPSSKLTWRHFRKMEEVLNGYVTNPNPTLTLTSTLTVTQTELIKKSKKKRLQKIDRVVCWMENSANHFIFADEQLYMVLYELQPC